MKKQFSRALTLAGVGLSLTGCIDLEEKIVSGVTASYFETASGLEDAVAAAYNGLYGHYGQEQSFTMIEYGVDIWAMGADGSNKGFNMYDGRLNATAGPVNTQWTSGYQAINAANAAISRAANLQGGMPEERKARRVAEARFLRAHYYFYLLRQFGPVHITLEETVGVITEARRSSEADVYAQVIIPDLEYAIATLPVQPEAVGRVSKGAAQHMLALVYLTRQNPGDAALAEGLAKAVINSGQYALQPDWRTLWRIDQDASREMIFTMQSTSNPLTWGSGNRWHLYWNMVYDGEPGMTRTLQYGRPFRRMYHSAFFMDSLFQRNIDARYDDGFRFVWFANNPVTLPAGMQLGDTAIFMPRVKTSQLDQATYCNKPYVIYTEPDNFWTPRLRPIASCAALKGEYNTSSFPALLKHADSLRAAVNDEQGRRDFPIYRLGETYLLAAEALIRQGKAAEAVPFVNAVRERAAKPGQAVAMRATADQMTLAFILDERARELYGEGHRWFDLRRFGTFVELIRGRNVDARPFIQSHHILRPIPQNQLDRTVNEDGTPFGQNPGY